MSGTFCAVDDASACASINQGVISDVCIRVDRRMIVGPIIGMVDIGLAMGQVLYGLVAWRNVKAGIVL